MPGDDHLKVMRKDKNLSLPHLENIEGSHTIFANVHGAGPRSQEKRKWLKTMVGDLTGSAVTVGHGGAMAAFVAGDLRS